MIYKSYLIEKNFSLLNEKIILFYGENHGLKDDLKRVIKNQNKNYEIIDFYQEDLLKDDDLFFREILNISLFSDEKIFLINQANDRILELIKKIETKIDNRKVFLFSELLDKKSKLRNFFEKSNTLGIVPCYNDNEISLKKIILNKLEGYTGLSNQNLNIILENCGLDRSKLNNELDKIAIYFKNKNIDTNKLEDLLNLKVNDSFDLLKDQALIGDKAKTNKLMSDTILEDDKNIFYLSVINHRLKKLLEVNEIAKSSNLEDAISKIKPPIFWKDKTIFSFQAKKWSIHKLKNILDQTYMLEIKIKSNSQISKGLIIKKLLVDMCYLANAS